MKNKVYISGPISQLSRDEYMARFAYAEKLLKADGYDVVNPTKLAPCRWPWLYRIMGYKLTLLYDIWWMLKCEYEFSMPRDVESKGAMIEMDIAYRFNIPYPPKDDVYFNEMLEFIKARKKQ